MEYVTSWGNLTLGDVYPVNGSAPDYDIVTGYAPYTTDNPTFIRFEDYKVKVQELTNVSSEVDSFRSTSFTSIEELQQAVNGGRFKHMNDNIYWLWGTPYNGGVGLINEDATHVRVVMFWGVYSQAGVFYVDVGDIRQPYKIQINRDAHAYELIGKTTAFVATNGTYDNGIFFTLVAEVVGEKIKINELHQTVGYVTGVASCNEGYEEKPEGGVTPLWYDVAFTDTPEQATIDWTNAFCYLTPVEPSMWSLLDPIEEYNYAKGRLFQRKINVMDTKYDFNAYIDSNIFSGAKPVNSAYPNSNSTSDGGYTDQNRYSEPIDDGGLPKEDLLGYGIVNLYKVDKSEMQDLMQFLYADISSNVVDAIKNMMTDPLQAIISAHMIHMNPTISGLEEIKFCGYGTGCQAYAISQQYYEYEWEINISDFYGAYLDYEGTRIKLALPYVGIEEIDPRYFLGGKMTVRYYVDILTGMVIVHVYADTVQKGPKNIELDAPIYIFNGNCILSFPMTSVNWANTFQAIIGLVSTVAGGGGVGAGLAQLGDSITKPLAEYKHSGSISSNYGYFGIDKPYIIVEHTEIALPNTKINDMYYPYAFGYPTEQTYKIKDMLNFKNYDDDNDVGIFFKVEPGTAYVSNIHCTDEEKQEIKRLLEEGVYMWYE